MPEGCHEIVPGLWLGSRRAVSLSNFQELKIDVVITVMDPEDITDHGIDVIMDDACEDLGVSWITCDVNDTPEDQICVYFKDVSDVLEQCVMGGKRVLIHCLGGVSRSPTLVCAYLMKSCHLGWKESLTFVQGKRTCVNPNFGFLAQLEEWGKECNKEMSKSGCEEK